MSPFIPLIILFFIASAAATGAFAYYLLNKTEPVPMAETNGAVENVSFDFSTGDFSFAGLEGVDEYRVRIFPVTDGVESELPINESQPLRGGKTSYTGNIPMWSCTNGATYNVYVLTTFEDGSASTSTAVSGVYTAQ